MFYMYKFAAAAAVVVVVVVVVMSGKDKERSKKVNPSQNALYTLQLIDFEVEIEL